MNSWVGIPLRGCQNPIWDFYTAARPGLVVGTRSTRWMSNSQEVLKKLKKRRPGAGTGGVRGGGEVRAVLEGVLTQLRREAKEGEYLHSITAEDQLLPESEGRDLPDWDPDGGEDVGRQHQIAVFHLASHGPRG